MEDVPELPRPVFRDVRVVVLVHDVDATQEVDQLIALGGVRHRELRVGESGIAFIERRKRAGADRRGAAGRSADARDGLDHASPGGDAVQEPAGFPDRGVARLADIRRRRSRRRGVNRDEAVGVALVGLEESVPERAGLIGLEGRQVGLRASGRAGRRNDRRRKGEGGGQDALDLFLEHLLELRRVLRLEVEAAAVLGRVLQNVVGARRLVGRAEGEPDGVHDDVLLAGVQGRKIGGEAGCCLVLRFQVAVLQAVRDQDDEVRLARADRGLDRGRIGVSVLELGALVVIVAVPQELAQRREAERGDRFDRRLHHGGAGPHLRDHRPTAVGGAVAAGAVSVVHPELHEAEANAGHVVDQALEGALGDVDLLLAGTDHDRAEPDLVVEVVAEVEVNLGAADAPGPVADRVQRLARRVLVHVGHGLRVHGVLAARDGLVHDRGGAGRGLQVPALVDDVVGVIRNVRLRVDDFVHTARVVEQDQDVGLDVGAEDVAVVGESRRRHNQRRDGRGSHEERAQSLHAFHG